jgi:hypothetical protein
MKTSVNLPTVHDLSDVSSIDLIWKNPIPRPNMRPGPKEFPPGVNTQADPIDKDRYMALVAQKFERNWRLEIEGCGATP